MTDRPLTSESITPPDSEDIQSIFETIEDSTAFWQVLFNDTVCDQDDGLPVSLTQVSATADWLKMSSAPLYPSLAVGGLRGLIYRFLNLIIKLFGNPQIRFNRKFRDFLGELLTILQESNIQIEKLKSKVANLNDRLQTLEAENYGYRQDINALAGQVEELRSNLDQMSGKHNTENRF